MSTLPELRPMLHTSPAGRIVHSGLYSGDSAFSSPTFIFITHDEKLAIQYWHDWRAPSETSTMDSFLAKVTLHVATQDTALQRTVLHCRDPRIGSGAMHLYVELNITASTEIREKMGRIPRYTELIRVQDSIQSLRVQTLPLLPGSDEYWEVQAQLKEEIETQDILHNRFIADRRDADRDAERTVKSRYAKIQDLYQISAAYEGPYTMEERQEVIECEKRGDISRVREIIQDRKARIEAAAAEQFM
ncbi:Hypothetical protein D9617_5g070050 [Elsinoe fawcettii]|nr:Hypothetical protein D9617_5g070050 [Elsinoe fawcettii]